MTEPAPATTWAITFTASGTVEQGIAPDPITEESS